MYVYIYYIKYLRDKNTNCLGEAEKKVFPFLEPFFQRSKVSTAIKLGGVREGG